MCILTRCNNIHVSVEEHDDIAAVASAHIPEIASIPAFALPFVREYRGGSRLPLAAPPPKALFGKAGDNWNKGERGLI